MGFNLNNIQKGIKKMPRKIIIYGPPKLGKSTLAASARNSLMIPTEDRVAHIDCDKTPVIKNYKEIIDIFDFLITEKGKHTYKRVIVDSLDWAEPLLHQYICEKKGFKSLTDDHNKETAFSKGLKYHAVEAWKSFLHNCDILRKEGFDVIFVAHSHSITINPPTTDSYDKSVMKLDKNALSVLEEWADVIAFYDKEILVKKDDAGINTKKGKALENPTGAKRVLHLSGENPAMMNGNSFGLGDATVTLDYCSDIMEWLLTEDNNNNKNTTKGDKK
jgi:hypothetical protein